MTHENSTLRLGPELKLADILNGRQTLEGVSKVLNEYGIEYEINDLRSLVTPETQRDWHIEQ